MFVALCAQNPVNVMYSQGTIQKQSNLKLTAENSRKTEHKTQGESTGMKNIVKAKKCW